MPRKRPEQPRQSLPTPLPIDRGQCPGCWRLVPVDDAGKIAVHQVRAGYHGGQVPLVECGGSDQEPAGPIVHSSARRF
jgi:hypothetical protein